MPLPPAVIGLLAALMAVTQLCAWLALGSYWLRHADHRVTIPLALLMGSALTACLYAVLAWMGQVSTAIVVGPSIALLSLLWHRQRVWHMLCSLGTLYRTLWADWPWVRWCVLATVILYWALALAPPRDADVLRYHLGHIRQIDMEGVWAPIRDYHYALPFGWSLNYLPFEHIGMPQVAQMLNLGLLLVAVAVAYDWFTPRVPQWLALVLCALFVFHPSVMNMATTAPADMYNIFIMLITIWLAVHLPQSHARGYGLLGFAAWIGVQSRYQAIAIGLSVSLLVCLLSLRRRASFAALRMYVAGAGCALLLSAPFYIFNWLAFYNPFWPLLSATVNGLQSYTDQMASAFNTRLHGTLRVSALLRGVWRLLTSVEVFPIPLCSIGLLGIALRWRDHTVRTVAMILAMFLTLWALTQQNLFPRFSFVLVGPVLLGWAPVLSRWVQAPQRQRRLAIGLGLLWLGFAGVDVVYALDYLRYAVTGDKVAFHRHTWFYQAFDWVNHHTPPDARLLVIVTSAQSYYLHRPLRRADPEFSGVVDWASVQDAQALRQVLVAGQYDYIIYEKRDWSRYIAGQHMSAVIAQALTQGVVTQIAAFDETLTKSRLRGTGYTTTVTVLQRQP
jgi:hypothetical protein